MVASVLESVEAGGSGFLERTSSSMRVVSLDLRFAAKRSQSMSIAATWDNPDSTAISRALRAAGKSIGRTPCRCQRAECSEERRAAMPAEAHAPQLTLQVVMPRLDRKCARASRNAFPAA